MSPEHFDAVIVGAGPAGSAAAIRLRLANPRLRVALIDKTNFPRDKACGDGLGPGAVPQLAALGVDISTIEHANRVEFAEVHGPDGLSFRAGMGAASRRHAHGATARRFDFDRLLARRAQETGADLMENTRFLSFRAAHGCNEVLFKNISTDRATTVKCELLVGADGANSRVRRAAGIGPNPAKKTGIAIRCYAKLPSYSSDRIVLSFEDDLRPGYGWCFPFADGTANANVAKVARLLWEGMGFGWTEVCYSGVTFPLTDTAFDRVTRLGFKRIIVFPYFLFTGVLVKRIYTHADAAAQRHPHVEFVKAGYLNDHPLVFDTFVERLDEILEGENLMNCRLCKYREQMIGFEGEVGAVQESHHHHVEGIGTDGDGQHHHGHLHHHEHGDNH